MKPYTTTIEHILPGMIVRAQDVTEGGTAVLRVLHTYVYKDGDARIGGDLLSVDVKRTSQVTVLHDPTQDAQESRVIINGPWDDDMTEVIRRSVEQVLPYHKDRGPQQYKMGGVEANTVSGPFSNATSGPF